MKQAPLLLAVLSLSMCFSGSALADAAHPVSVDRQAGPSATGTATADRGLCQAEETVYFACSTARARVVSVCGKAGELQYRFGRPGKIELAFPASPADGPSQLLYADYFREQVTRVEVGFEREGADYAVYDYQEGGQHVAGVRVTTAEGKEVNLSCQGRFISRLRDLKSLLPCDKENALNGGQCNR